MKLITHGFLSQTTNEVTDCQQTLALSKNGLIQREMRRDFFQWQASCVGVCGGWVGDDFGGL